MASVAEQEFLDLESADFKRCLKWSVSAHVIALFFLLAKAVLFPGKPNLYLPSLRVDVVALPDILKKDLKDASHQTPSDKEIAEALKKAEIQANKIRPKIVETKEKTEPDEMVLKPKQANSSVTREKKMKSALDRIKALEKIMDSDAKSKPVVMKGNKLSAGTSLSADARESAQASYYDILRDRLQENWALPVWLSRQKLSAQVQIEIDSHGRLRGFRFVKSSGNTQFDEAVKKTVSDSQPFPNPPDNILGSVSSDGILVGFPL